MIDELEKLVNVIKATATSQQKQSVDKTLKLSPVSDSFSVKLIATMSPQLKMLSLCLSNGHIFAQCLSVKNQCITRFFVG